MTSIRVINEYGEEVQKEIFSRGVTIVDGDMYNPDDEIKLDAAQRVEYDHQREVSTITTVCGESEARNESDDPPELTIEGTVGQDNMYRLKNIDRGQEVTVVTDLHYSSMLVRRVTVEQSSDVLSINRNGEEELAFSFQIQLKEPEG